MIDNVMTVLEGEPLFRKNDGVAWPLRVTEGAQPHYVAQTYIQVLDRQQALENFRAARKTQGKTWLQFNTSQGPTHAEVVAMGPARDSEDHVILWVRAQ